MIDALRKDAWPRGVRRVRRELEAAREKLRATLGHEPSLADLAARIGSDEKRLGKTIVRINTIESTSPLSCGDNVDEAQLPAVLVPAEPERPDMQYEREPKCASACAARSTLPPRERRVIALYYYGEVTMKEIGAELGVNESRVSQLHARALRRLREALGAEMTPAAAVGSAARGDPGVRGRSRRWPRPSPPQVRHARAGGGRRSVPVAATRGYASVSRRRAASRPSLNGLASQRQPVSSRNRSASVPATSPVTKMTRRASAGVAAAIAR